MPNDKRWTDIKHNQVDATILRIKRKYYTDESTIGELSVDGVFECFSLEDTVRKNGIKIYGRTAIPEGRYEVVISYSNRFKKMLPLLLNVPNFKGIRIHTGNRPEDTEGCIIVGKGRSNNFVVDSRKAFTDLMMKIETALRSRKVYMDIA